METRNLLTFALGLVTVAVGALLPPTSAVLMPAGTFLLGWAMRQPSKIGKGGTAALAFTVGLGLCLHGSPARADANNPLTGGCLAKEADGITCKVSVHASAISPAAVLDLATGKLAAGTEATALGPCYGVTYKPTSAWASGADLCVLLSVAQAQPNKLGAALMFHLSSFLSAGIGVTGTEAANAGLQPQWSVYLAPRLPVQ